MSRFPKWLAVVLCTSMLLSGCWNALDIEQMLYIDSIGVDYVDKKVVVYLQDIGFSNIAKKESNQKETEEKIAVVKGTGNTVEGAILQIYSSSQQRLVWSHVHSIVFTERALKNHLFSQAMDTLDRYQEFRYTIWTFATKDSLEDIFYSRPILGISTLYAMLANPKSVYNQYLLIRPILLVHVISKHNEPNGVVRLPYLTILKNQWTENNMPKPHLKMDGFCFMQDNHLLGCLSRKDASGIRWIDKKTERTFLHPTKKGSAILTLEKLHVHIDPQLKGGKPAFHIKVKAEGYTTQVLEPTPIHKLEKEAQKKIESEIRHVYEKGLKEGIDTLGLGHLFYRKYPHDWHRLSKDGTLPLVRDSIQSIRAKINITDGGISKIRQHKSPHQKKR
ncbi:Ger(x)C family spore germination protein [Brevibacillus ruminantium]|uniref:Ger(X)C family spore germination protein n=1 Tax=Brevibacillus ruminantium TaxID=2950604 RepID=A0ABY4WHU5_9BACL|nr:Ger(x)C family spore germination protein [Brevibacillus ruminantium]USG66718.1 Ger(x)C family spore germination protein [Brevibacillus ruminantium]